MSSYNTLNPEIPFQAGVIDPRLSRDTRLTKYLGIFYTVAFSLIFLMMLGLLIPVLLWTSTLILIVSVTIIMILWKKAELEGSKYNSIVVIGKHELEYERYQLKRDALFRTWRRLPLDQISSIKVESPDSSPEPRLREKYPTADSVAWRLSISTFNGAQIEIVRYPFIIIRTANDIHALRSKRFGGPFLESKPSSDYRAPWGRDGSDSTSLELGKSPDGLILNDVGKVSAVPIYVALFFIGCWALMVVTFGGMGFIIGIVTTFPVVLTILLLSLPKYLSPQAIRFKGTGLDMMSRRNNVRFVHWNEIVGIEDPIMHEKQCHMVLDKGRPIMLSGSLAIVIGERFREVHGRYPPLLSLGRNSNNTAQLRKFHRREGIW